MKFSQYFVLCFLIFSGRMGAPASRPAASRPGMGGGGGGGGMSAQASAQIEELNAQVNTNF